MGAEKITVGVEEAQKKLSRLISQVEKGHRVTILRHGKPAVEIVPINSESEQKQLRAEQIQEKKKLLAATREFAARVRSHIRGEKARQEKAKFVRLSERRLRQVLEGASEAVLEADADGKILLVNRAAEKMFGYSRHELLELSVEQLVPPDLRARHAQDRADYVRNPQVRPMGLGRELTAQKKNGSCFPVDVGLSPYWVDGTFRVIVLVHDVTRRKEIEEAFRQSEEKLRQAEKLEALARMAGGTAHEFNNLLTMIMGYAALMLSSIDSRKTLIDYIEKISRSSKRAAELTRQLLAFSRRQMLAPQTLDMNLVLSEARQILPSLIGPNIETSFEPAAEPALVCADRSQIHQVIVHLVFNARDAMPEGGKLAIRIANIELESNATHEHPALAPGKYVQLTVSDTGVGMPREVQTRLFEPFFTTKEFGRGSGLNLAAIYGIVQQSRGNISVASTSGKGTTFTVLLPRAAQEELPAGEELVTSPAVQRGTETILLVEDEAPIRTLTREFLQGLGYEVLAAADGGEALRTAAQFTGRIDLLLTDVVMPSMSGRELARQLLPLRAGMKVLYVSGCVDDILAKEGLAATEEWFLEKPFAFDNLAEKIRTVLSGAPPQSAHAAD
jgi:two-component system, cell cycle sensor histidine kinase and response regulator CckA